MLSSIEVGLQPLSVLNSSIVLFHLHHSSPPCQPRSHNTLNTWLFTKQMPDQIPFPSYDVYDVSPNWSYQILPSLELFCGAVAIGSWQFYVGIWSGIRLTFLRLPFSVFRSHIHIILLTKQWSWWEAKYYFFFLFISPIFQIDWMIDYLLFYVPLKNISLIWRRHRYRWRAENLGLCSALRASEQGGIFIVPHLLWHGTSVFPVSSEGPPHSVAS
jgi:hypothetical protein